MPSNREIQPSDAEIEALTAEIKNISSNEKLRLRPALEALLPLIEASVDASPVEIIRKWLSLRKSPQTVEKVFHPDLPLRD
jgi:hypothetical protein